MTKLWIKTLLYECSNIYRRQRNLESRLHSLALYGGRQGACAEEDCSAALELHLRRGLLLAALSALAAGMNLIGRSERVLLREFFIKRRTEREYLELTGLSLAEFRKKKRAALDALARAMPAHALGGGVLDALKQYDFIRASLRRFE